jgi:hypothetical protein
MLIGDAYCFSNLKGARQGVKYRISSGMICLNGIGCDFDKESCWDFDIVTIPWSSKTHSSVILWPS